MFVRLIGNERDRKKLVSKNKIGRVSLGKVKPEKHEYDTFYFLASHGFNIEIIKPSNIPKTKSPDVLLDGVIWEIKSPTGSGNSTIGRQFHKASKQADRLILDLRRVNILASKAESQAKSRFSKATNIRRLLLITKDGRLLDIRR